MISSCDRCGLFLDEADLKFIVEIGITADVAPSLDLEMSGAQVEAELAEVLELLEAASGEEAERDVHQRMVFILCPLCRVKFVREPLGPGGSSQRPLQ